MNYFLFKSHSEPSNFGMRAYFQLISRHRKLRAEPEQAFYAIVC